MALSWKKLALALFGFDAAGTATVKTKLNASRELHVKDADAAGFLARFRNGSGEINTAQRRNQFEARFFEQDPNEILKVNVQTGSASMAQGAGEAEFHTGTTAGSVLDVETWETIVYASAFEWFANASATLPVVAGTAKIQLGPFDVNDGYFIERTANGDALYVRTGGVDTPVPWANRNGDALDESAGSKFTRGGVEEALKLEKFNVHDWGGLWLGGAPVSHGVLSPDSKEDGEIYVRSHTFRHPNLNDDVATNSPNLPMRLRIENGDQAVDYVVKSGCWRGGTASPVQIPLQSRANSSTVLLTDAAPTYTGNPVSTLNYPYVQVRLKIDKATTARIEWHDIAGTPLGDPVTIIEHPGDGSTQYATVPRRGEYVKITLQKTGSGDATETNLGTALTDTPPEPELRPMSQDIPRNTLAQSVQAGLFTLNEDTGPPGTPPKFIPHRGTETYGPRVDVKRSALPTGAATSAKQTDANTLLTRIIDTLGEDAADTLLGMLQSIEAEDFAQETTLSSILGQLDITQSQLRDALRGTGAQTLTTLHTSLGTDGGTPPTVGTGVRGWLRSIYDKVVSLLAKDSEGRLAVTAHDSLGKDINDGIVFAVGAEVTLSSGQNGAIVVENGAGSGVAFVLLGLKVWHSVVDSLDVVFFENPTVSGGTVLTPFNLNRASATTSQVTVTAGQGIISGGTLLDIHGRSSRDSPYETDGGVIIPPGVKMAFRLIAPGGLTGGTDLSATAVFKEVTL